MEKGCDADESLRLLLHWHWHWQLLSLLEASTEHDVPEEQPPLECTDGGAVTWSSLGGVYPNASGQGIAQGHLFALRVRLGLVTTG